ncbi:MAG: apolipoprotein N-acyltransferase [Pirellulales bacterium]|nr:apolipoprotein N-acyltransferase [Pirellulales bacterium]
MGGLVYFLTGTDWIRTIDQGIYLSGPRVGDWLFQAALLALSWPVVYWLGCLLNRESRLGLSVNLPVLWVTYEFGLRHLWAIVDGNGWYMTKIAYALANRLPLIQIADLGGIYAVSFVIAAVNGAVFDCLARRRNAYLSAAFAASLVAASAGYGVWRLSQPAGRQGPLVSLMPAQPRRIWESPTEPIVRSDLLVWSENVLDQPVIDKNQDFDEQWLESAAPGATEHFDDDPHYVRGALDRYAKKVKATVVVGAPHIEFGRSGALVFNSAACVDPQFGYEGCYDKVWLVPWVETTPYHRVALGSGTSLELTPGNKYPIFRTSRGDRFAIAICYDVMFPELFRTYSKDRPDFFVICSSEMTDKTLRLQRETFVCAQFRAIESRRAIVRNARNGFSGMTDSNGRTIARAEELELTEPFSVGRVPVDRRGTLYAWAGDWLPVATSTALAVVVLPPIGRRFKRIFPRVPNANG